MSFADSMSADELRALTDQVIQIAGLQREAIPAVQYSTLQAGVIVSVQALERLGYRIVRPLKAVSE